MHRIQTRFAIVCVSMACVGWLACSGPRQASPFENQLWYAPRAATEVLAHSSKIGGCSAGDLDGVPGDEILAVAGDGSVLLAWIEAGAWKHAVIAKLPGEAIGVKVLGLGGGHGSFVTVGKEAGDEESPGPGVAYLFSRALASTGPLDQSWTRETLLVEDALVHAVDASGQGIAIAGYAQKLHWFAPAPGGLMDYVVGTLPGPAKGVAIDGRNIAVACSSGELVAFQRPERDGEPWKQRVVWRFPAALARIDALGGHIAVSSNDGGLYAYEQGLQGDILFYQSSDRLRGAVFLQGPETRLETPWFLATAGYNGIVSVFPRKGLLGDSTQLAVDKERLHHLAGARLALPGTRGLTPALVTSGYSGRLLVVPFERFHTAAQGSADQGMEP